MYTRFFYYDDTNSERLVKAVWLLISIEVRFLECKENLMNAAALLECYYFLSLIYTIVPVFHFLCDFPLG